MNDLEKIIKCQDLKITELLKLNRAIIEVLVYSVYPKDKARKVIAEVKDSITVLEKEVRDTINGE